MNIKAITRKAVTLCLSFLVLSTLSLASTGKIIGELTVNKLNDKAPQVKVNNVLAQSGHTVFSANTITTNEDAGATLSLDKFGTVNVAPNSVVSFSTSKTGIAGEIIAGEITTFSDSLIVKTVEGSIITPKFGETVSSTGVVKAIGDDERDANGKCIDKDGDGVLECDKKITSGVLLALIAAGGVAAFAIYLGTRDSNGSTVVSPIR